MYDFEVLTPKTVEEALELKNKYRKELIPMAGGTDLFIAYRNNRKKLTRVLNLNHVNELKGIELKGNKLLIKSLATHSDVIGDPNVLKYFPSLAEALEIIGSIQIRNQSTLVGNLSNASPAADSLPLLYCANATATIRSNTHNEDILIEELITGPGMMKLPENAIITSVNIPIEKIGKMKGDYISLRQRNSISINKVSVGLLIKQNDDLIIDDARIAIGAVAPTVLRVKQAEELLIGNKATMEIVKKASEISQETAVPITDVRSSIEYRDAMVQVITRRLLKKLLKIE